MTMNIAISSLVMLTKFARESHHTDNIFKLLHIIFIYIYLYCILFLYKNKMTQNESLVSLLHMLNKLENDVAKAKAAVQKMFGDEGNAYNAIPTSSSVSMADEEGMHVVEGKFDGTFMQWDDGKMYPVPMNYASKTKLIPGDMLKLRIMEDGKLIYKVTGPAPRKFLKAKLTKTEEGKFIALTEENKTYALNQAAVTFFKWTIGNEITIIVNGGEDTNVAAIEAVISK